MRIKRRVPVLFIVVLLSAAAAASGGPPLIGADAEFARIAQRAPGFGGMYYDADGRLNVFMTVAARQSAVASAAVLKQVAASLTSQGRPVPANADIVIHTGARDFLELASLHERMFPLIGESGVVFTDIDESRNRLTIGVLASTSASDIQGELRALGIPQDAVDIEVTRAIAPLSGGTLEDLQVPFGGGTQIGFYDNDGIYICTAGFNVLRGAVDRQSKYFVTASHCTLDEGVVTGLDYWAPLPFGIVQPYAFLGVEVEDPSYFVCGATFRCRYSDSAMVRYDDGSRAEVGRIYRTEYFGTNGAPGSVDIDVSNPPFSVVSEESWSMVGDVVDKMGRTTGWSRGAVTRNCANLVRSVNPPRALLCQAFASATSYFGDSGSPVFEPIGQSSNVRLHGILWGGPAQPPYDFFVYSIMDAIRQDFDGADCRWTGPDGTVRCPADRTFRTH